jgi:hypothetical protein
VPFEFSYLRSKPPHHISECDAHGHRRNLGSHRHRSVVRRLWSPAARDPPIRCLTAATIGMIVFGAAAAIALVVHHVIGAYVVAAGLLAHAAWDAYHHVANKVVARSIGRVLLVLDAVLAVAIVIATVRA